MWATTSFVVIMVVMFPSLNNLIVAMVSVSCRRSMRWRPMMMMRFLLLFIKRSMMVAVAGTMMIVFGHPYFEYSCIWLILVVFDVVYAFSMKVTSDNKEILSCKSFGKRIMSHHAEWTWSKKHSRRAFSYLRWMPVELLLRWLRVRLFWPIL